ncbi:hypothetical protein VB712_11465 [Spirulina sp. CCNP1310]|uniref:hypothetical protein n=1 Tax=Spirulina sp. CCNP1310 TaxID=3110249 RepID=UPI002B1F54B4|nr:hypothetical protein [Spirulina sp. CCNP1310]MEA5419844.1 hypothetical protein [Spirulina sp. CCNP1310]
MNGAKPPELENQEQIKVQELTLILQHLIEREEVTVRFILDRLYEMGTANLMHHHVQWRSLHPPLYHIARLSQPLFRRAGILWFNHHGAKLITRWLHSLVRFKPAPEPQTLEITAYTVTNAEIKRLPPSMIIQHPQVQQLRSQVRLLGLCLIGGIAMVSSSIFWLDYRLKPATSEFLQDQGPQQVKYKDDSHL